tara:strand:- start:2176 stop:3024 length:849 start_codon:yes stop_codon:yes gene_type:complete
MANKQEVEEPKANPYNAKKSWHDESGPEPMQNADSLFFEKPTEEATSENEDGTPQKKTRTNYKKRYDDLKKHYDTKLSEFKQREQELRAEAEKVNPQYKPPKSVEDLEKFKTEYPDLYETVETVAHMRSEEQVSALQSKLQVLEEREATISKRDAEAELQARHPDFEDIRGDNNFHAWAKTQPEDIQNWIYNNPDNATLASRAIDLYKLENNIAIGNTTPRQSARSQTSSSGAAEMVSTKTTNVEPNQAKVWTQREIASMSMDEYDKYEKEIDLAIREGRVR